MAIQHKVYTADDLWELSKLPEYADKRIELIEGELIEMSPSSMTPSVISAIIHILLGAYVMEHDLGYTNVSEGGYALSPNNVLAPDVGFFTKDRATKLPRRYFHGAPDLAVEVVSPTDDAKETLRKAAKYIAYGTRLVWIVYPKYKSVDICRPATDGDMVIQEIGIDGVLDGGDVVPGFTLAIKDIFNIPDEESE